MKSGLVALELRTLLLLLHAVHCAAPTGSSFSSHGHNPALAAHMHLKASSDHLGSSPNVEQGASTFLPNASAVACSITAAAVALCSRKRSNKKLSFSRHGCANEDASGQPHGLKGNHSHQPEHAFEAHLKEAGRSGYGAMIPEGVCSGEQSSSKGKRDNSGFVDVNDESCWNSSFEVDSAIWDQLWSADDEPFCSGNDPHEEDGSAIGNDADFQVEDDVDSSSPGSTFWTALQMFQENTEFDGTSSDALPDEVPLELEDEAEDFSASSDEEEEEGAIAQNGSSGKLWSNIQFPEGTIGIANYDMANLQAAQDWTCPCIDRMNCIGRDRLPNIFELYEHRKLFRNTAHTRGGYRDACRSELTQRYDAKSRSFTRSFKVC